MGVRQGRIPLEIGGQYSKVSRTGFGSTPKEIFFPNLLREQSPEHSTCLIWAELMYNGLAGEEQGMPPHFFRLRLLRRVCAERES